MKKIVILSLLFAALGAHSQQDAMFTHYMYNTLWLNPAYAGTRDALTVTGIHRSMGWLRWGSSRPDVYHAFSVCEWKNGTRAQYSE
jgi:hypothetical protein